VHTSGMTRALPCLLLVLSACSGGDAAPSAAGTSLPPRTFAPRSDCSGNASIRVCPARGPIGTPVVVEGIGCNLGSPDMTLVFTNEGGAHGTFGAVVLNAVEAPDRYFTTPWRVPAEMGGIQGRGGGPTTPGTYRFYTKPPVCDGATFTVTAS
jgi:hypothetical protein